MGLSFFPFWLEKGQAYDSSIGGMTLDGIRSAGDGKPMWVEELQGGPSIFGLSCRSRFPTPSDIRTWNSQCVAHGTTGIFYWNWRPETTGISRNLVSHPIHERVFKEIDAYPRTLIRVVVLSPTY